MAALAAGDWLPGLTPRLTLKDAALAAHTSCWVCYTTRLEPGVRGTMASFGVGE